MKKITTSILVILILSTNIQANELAKYAVVGVVHFVGGMLLGAEIKEQIKKWEKDDKKPVHTSHKIQNRIADNNNDEEIVRILNSYSHLE